MKTGNVSPVIHAATIAYGFVFLHPFEDGNGTTSRLCYLLQDPSTVEREFGNLEKIDDNYPKLVLSMDRFFPEERKGILHRYIVDFLLG